MDVPVGSPQALLSAVHTHLLECKVCMETFSFGVDEEPDRRPMILCCGHVLCAECVCHLTSSSSAADRHTLHCPFCRLPSDRTRVSLCRPISDLQELLLEHESSASSDSAPPPAGPERKSSAPGPGSGWALERRTLQLVRAFGGWGTLVNPTGLALFRSGALAVVHAGKARVAVFGPQGRCLHTFGQRGEGAEGGDGAGLTHPLGVAVLPGGQVVVSDAGDSALKMFTSRGRALADARDWFQLPWGVCVSADGGVLVADSQRGALVRLEAGGSSSSGALGGRRVLLQGLKNPRAIACCPLTGHIAVLEHLVGNTHARIHTPAHTSPSVSSTHTCTPGHTLALEHTHTSSKHTHGSSAATHPPPHTHSHVVSTRLKLYRSDLTPLCQIDALSLGLRTGSPAPPLCLTAVTFDLAGHLVAADARSGVVWSLGRLQEDGGVTLTPLVRDKLIRPVGLAVSGDTLVVLDGGDHSVKMYSSQTA